MQLMNKHSYTKETGMIIDLDILTSNSQHMETNKQHFSVVLIRVLSFLFITLLLIQCTGPEGPMGPHGPKGEDGVNGIDGINYTYSAIYDIDPAEWDGGIDGYWVTLDVPEITDDIYYNGALLVYRLIETEPKSFNLLPYTYVDNNLTIYMDFDAYICSIDIYYKEILDGINDTYAPDQVMSFKVVMIEGLPLASLKNMVNISDFSAVAKLLNIDQNNSKELRF
jgi:hypothetical protein